MTDEDTRSLPAAAQAALRTRAVRAVLGGMTQAEAARVFGVHPNAVNRWIRRYREGGLAGLSARRRGGAGRQAALTETQQQEVVALVRETTPDQLGLAGFLWTREAVGELIARRYGVRLARTTMGACVDGGSARRSPSGGLWSRTRPRCAAGWPRPIPPSGRRPDGRGDGVVAGRDGGALGCDRGSLLGAGGPTPVIRGTGKCFRVNMLSAISNAGRLRFRLHRVVHRRGVHRVPRPAAGR